MTINGIKKLSQFFIRKKNGFVVRIKRHILKLKGTPRPTRYPVISGDSFRALADHIHDETTTFIAGGVALGDIVFVSQSKALRFLQEIHPNILVPYILIVHNGDEKFDSRYTALFDDKIIHCFAQCVTVDHEKVTPLPIGLSNVHSYEHTEAPYCVPPSHQSEEEYKKRKNKFFYRFAVHTCPSVRIPLLKYCNGHPLMETSLERVSESRFIEVLKEYKFLVSPRGNAIDTLRPYEAFHLGLVPVVEDSVTIRSLHNLGLPFWIVNNWNELSTYDEESLSRKYAELMKNANFDALHMDFWIKRIKAHQNTARNTL